MACNNQFRHVCLKDLENYIKRDEYFSDFSDEEKAISFEIVGASVGWDKLVKAIKERLPKESKEL